MPLAFFPEIHDPKMFHDLIVDPNGANQIEASCKKPDGPLSQVVPDQHRIFYPQIYLDRNGTAKRAFAVSMAMIDACTKNFVLYLKSVLRQIPTSNEQWALPFGLLNLLLIK